MSPTFDEAALVCVAATVLGMPPDDVLDHADVAALARLAAAQERTRSTTEAAAAILAGVIRERPFPSGNTAVAWLAAAALAPVQVDDADALDLIEGLELGILDHEAIEHFFVAHARPTRAQRLARWLKTPARPFPEPTTELLPCPACGRTVERTRWGGAWAGAPRDELVALCARQHHEHTRRELVSVG